MTGDPPMEDQLESAPMRHPEMSTTTDASGPSAHGVCLENEERLSTRMPEETLLTNALGPAPILVLRQSSECG
jgi:hypothetical protein